MKLVMVEFRSWLTFKPGTSVMFSADGVDLLVGENGAGKSALAVEAAAWVLWGETARGSDVPDGDVSAVVMGDDGKVWGVARKRSGRRLESLTLRSGGPLGQEAKDESGQTPTETQAKVNQLFGDWRRHANTRVFSRVLLSKFGTATNKERQALLESILGLEQFSRAEKVARGVLNDRKMVLDLAANERSFAEGAHRRSSALAVEDGPPAPVRDLKPLEYRMDAALAEYEKARERLERAQKGLDRSQLQMDRLADQLVQVDGALMKLGGKVNNAAALEDCPVCLRAVDDGARAEIFAHYKAEGDPLLEQERVLKESVAVLEEDLGDQRSVVAQFKATVRTAMAEHDDARNALNVANDEAKVAQATAVARQKARDALAKDKAALDKAEYEVAKAQLAVTIAEAAVTTLGPRGARLRVLASSLVQLQVGTNAVLARLESPIRVAISGTKPQANGREVDEVVLKLKGAGGGQYAGASEGEKVRVDVAMLLALGNMARGAGDGGV
jgi:DNA repair exonuclease SbcCD ATPase subunit